MSDIKRRVVVIGAGPAGVSPAYGLAGMAERALERIGLAGAEDVSDNRVFRILKAYPVYHEGILDHQPPPREIP
jgi:protoporphyrinogen oxidase